MDVGDRDHHRAARPGRRDLGRDGDRPLLVAAHFNRPGYELFDYDVYALCGDGDMMEGITAEAASLAGHNALANLCWIYDNNRITIEGSTDLAFSDDVATRFIGYGWNVTRVGDANDRAGARARARDVQSESQRPTLIIVDSHIAYGAPTAWHELGPRRAARRGGGQTHQEGLRVPEDAQFLVPDGVREHFAARLGERGRPLREAWMEHFDGYREEHPDLADQLLRMQRREPPEGGTRRSRSSRPTRRAWPGARRRGRS